VIRSATVNPVEHLKLGFRDCFRPGDKPIFVLVDSLDKMNVQETWMQRASKVFDKGKVLFDYKPDTSVNNSIAARYMNLI